MRRYLLVALFLLVMILFVTRTPGAQVHIVRGFRAAITFIVNGIGTTTTAGVTLLNEAAAAAGAQQYSPALCLKGYGWGTGDNGGSKPAEVCFELRPVQSATNPTATLALMYSINDGARADWLTISGSGDGTITGQFTGSTGLYAGDNRPIGWAGDRALMRSAAPGVMTAANAAESSGIRFHFASAPSITTSGITGESFGSGPSILTGSTDTFGYVRVGSSTEGVIAFATDWGTINQQTCVANNENGVPTYVKVTDKTMRLAGGTLAVPVAWTSGSVVNWICGGSK